MVRNDQVTRSVQPCLQHQERSGRDAGFSLVEVMVVLVILTVGLLPLALVQMRAQQDVAESGRFSEAVHVAELRMEMAKGQGFGTAVTDSGLVEVYRWKTTVTTPSFGLEQIAVQVNWAQGGRQRSVQIMNMMSFR